MTGNGYTKFLVATTGPAPQTLSESIRKVSNTSAGFCRSWLTQDVPDALATSEDAFEFFDHIANEILRHRDTKSKLPGWSSSAFKTALAANVGHLLDPASASDKAHFSAQERGSGSMPSSSTPAPLTLDKALSKLKHRGPKNVNFTVSPLGVHILFIFTHEGGGRPDSISSFDVQAFCDACKVAAQTI